MQEFNKSIVFTGGGSAGHVVPNVAIIDALLKENSTNHIAYIGSEEGIERGLIEKINIPYYPIATGKLRRYFSVKNFTDPLRVLLGVWQAWKHLGKIKPQVVFSKGGFVAFPVVFSAWLRRIPVIVHESDLTPGLANRLSFPFARRIALTFGSSEPPHPSLPPQGGKEPVHKALKEQLNPTDSDVIKSVNINNNKNWKDPRNLQGEQNWKDPRNLQGEQNLQGQQVEFLPPLWGKARMGGKFIVTGTPIRENFFQGNAQKGREMCGFENNKPCLMIIGGGSGSTIINNALRKILPELLPKMNVIHCCGKGNMDINYLKNSEYNNYKQFDYVNEELANLYACAEVVISRAGANSAYEILALNKVALFIPLSKKASRGDQIANAYFLKSHGLCCVLDEDLLNSETLIHAIQGAFTQRTIIHEKIRQYGIKSGTEAIIQLIHNLTKTNEVNSGQ